MDPEVKALQEKLHQANEKRLTGLEDGQVEHREALVGIRLELTKIALNTACLPDLTKRVDTLESAEDGRKSKYDLLHLLWAGLLALFGIHEHMK